MYKNIDLFFSSDCNMRCVYCYLEKEKDAMVQYNNYMKVLMETGAYASNVIETLRDYKSSITGLSLWGAEPTLNADQFRSVAYPLWDYFENIDTLMFSTNTLLGVRALNKFIDATNEYCALNDRDIKIDIQISLDGDEWVNDVSRHKGATKNTIHVLEQIAETDYSSLRIKLNVFTKITLDCAFMKKMNEQEGGIYQYFKFFDDLHDSVLKKNLNSNVNFTINTTPTLVDPGYHTIEDGKVLAEWIKNVAETDTTGLKHYTNQTLFMQTFRNIKYILNENFNPVLETGFGICGAGNGSVCISGTGDVVGCHRLFRRLYLNLEEDSAFRCNSAKAGNKKDFLRYQYISSAIHEFADSRRAFMDIILLPMAKYGQVDPIYLTDPQRRNGLYLLLTGLMCHIGMAEDTRDTLLMITSYFKYLGNGAEEALMKYYFQNQGVLNG